ncbi:MAG TPA: hypothetical protein VEP67_08985 [Thiobacillaceae bacterium]|nr:hypothetical protein [Thiobacillaceae bacterium]
MTSLSKPLRTHLENTVKAARDVAETAARNALEHLGVGESSAPAHLTEEQRELRRRSRLHGRQLDDVKHKDERQDISHLVWEVAYENWHRMLFARFLAENNLLMWPSRWPTVMTSPRTKAHWMAGNVQEAMLPAFCLKSSARTPRTCSFASPRAPARAGQARLRPGPGHLPRFR